MKKTIIILIVMMLTVVLSAQVLDQKIEKPGRLFVGTPFSLYVEITSAISDSIYAPQLDSIDVFFPMGEPQQQETIQDDVKKNIIKMTFQAFDTGDYTFPSLEFLVKSDSRDTVLTTRDFVVIINSVLPDSADAIKDIAHPLSLKLGFWDFFIPIAGIIIIIALIIFLKKFFTKPEQPAEIPKFTDNRPIWQIAHEMLMELLNKKLLDKGENIEFYYRLSIILRYFIERHYKINALEMTTSEIRYNLKLDDSREKGDILKLLTESDKVKFAKYLPEREKAEDLASWFEAYLDSFKLRNPEVKDA
ncbi:MAG: hypothetical protein P9X26_01760 [Candidatus Stygibacter frigidus]|nr:hypothetical protein [Candidatus Stygibacter frigidus]